MRSLSKDFKKIEGKDWWSLLEWLRSIDPKSPSEGLLDILLGLIEHENKYVRLAAVGIFASWGGGGAKAAQGLSKRLTTDENEEIKELALQGLFGLGAAAIPALLDRLDEHDRNLSTSRLESRLLYSFFLEPRTSYLPAILEALERPSMTGQSLHALRASLERLGPQAKEAIPLLVRLAKQNPGHAFDIVWIFKAIGAEAIPAVTELFDLQRPGLPSSLFQVLSFFGIAASTALSAVLPYMEWNSTANLAEIAHAFDFLIALEEKAKPAFFRLQEFFESGMADLVSIEVIEKATLALAKMETEEATHLLLQELRSSRGQRRGLSARACGFQKGRSSEVFRVLLGMVEDDAEDSWIRLEAARSLAKFGSGARKAIPSLLRQVGRGRTHESLEYLRALAKIGPEEKEIETLREIARMDTSLQAEIESLFRLSESGRSVEVREGEGKVSSAAPSLPLQGGVTFSPEDWGPDEDTEVEEEERQEGSASLLRLPLNPNDVRFEIRPMSVDLLLARMKNQEILLQPEFQRKSVWTSVQKSLLIESMMLRIPIPAFYIDASDPKEWKVIDGQQRLTALRDFLLYDLQESLAFEGLEFFVEYNGKRRDALPRHLHRRLLESQVTVYTIETKMDASLSFHVFKRINTGGLPLSSQEIRHALYQGHATKLLEALSQDSFFKKAASFTDERMEARELLLQALSFRLTAPWLAPPQIDVRLNEAMLRLNGCSAKEIQSLQNDFCHAFQLSFELFGSNAFRKPSAKRRLPLNKTLFETIVPCFSFLTSEQGKKLLDKKKAFLEGWTELFQPLPEEKKGEEFSDRSRFLNSISKGYRNPLVLVARFRVLENLIRDILPEVIFWKEEKVPYA